jgi:hypothetical protein
MLAPNGQRSNLNKRQWIQVRTESFKEWFGDWEKAIPDIKYNNLKALDVPTVFTGKFEDVRAEALKEYHDLRDKNADGFHVPELDSKISMTGKPAMVRLGSNEKFSSNTGDTAKFQIIGMLPELLKRSIWYGFQPTQKVGQARNVAGFHYLLSKAVIGGHEFDVAFAVREDNNGNFYHNHTLYKEKGDQASWAEMESNASQRSEPAAISPDLSLYKPRPRVNMDDVSKVVDANGEPPLNKN